jgi:hypothetical protein
VMGAVSESLGEDSLRDLSRLLCGVLKGKGRLILGCKGMQKKVSGPE